MKLTKRLVTILACVLLGCLSVLLTQVALPQSYSLPDIKDLNEIPYNPRGRSASEINFNNFAWHTFVALNWPVHSSNGKKYSLMEIQKEENSDKKNPKDALTAPRVWEFYNFPENIFLEKGKDPRNKQGEVPSVIPPQSNSADPDLSFMRLTVAEGDKIDHGNRKVLIDRFGNYVLNETRINPIEVEQIVDNQWYSADNLEKFNNGKKRFVLICSKKPEVSVGNKFRRNKSGCKVNKDEGAIEIKAAWRVVEDDKKELDKIKSKYYVTTRTFLAKDIDGNEKPVNEKPVTVPVALIGFHIAQKTSNQGWIWSTFEHVDNAPNDKEKPLSKDYNLYNSKCGQKSPKRREPLKSDECATSNRSHAEEPYRWRDEFPHAVTDTDKKQITSQITRLVPIDDTTKNLNEKWQKRFKEIDGLSIWQNYQLIGTQWLENPNRYYRDYRDDNKKKISIGIKPTEGGKGSRLVNVTLEPYVQSTLAGKDNSAGRGNSCIKCHIGAKLPDNRSYADFSFLLNNAKSSF